MKPKTMILMVVAVVCGLGASYMTSRLLAEREDAPPEAAPVEKVKLLVAKKNLEMHLAFRGKPEDFFVEKDFVKDENTPKEALKKDDLSKLKDKFLKRGLRKDDHILLDDVMDTVGLKTLPKGMRAVGIQVNQAAVAGGWASLPGSHVDIVWTSRVSGNETFTKNLLEDIIVLSADTNDQTNNAGAVVASVVTVAVTPDDGIKLILAMDTGSLKLTVRNFEDKSSSDRDRYTVSDLQKSRNNKMTDPVVAEVQPPATITPPDKKAEDPPEPVQPKLKKMTVTLRQGTDYQVHHYWVDEDDRIVAAPANDSQFDPVPPGGGKKDDSKKDDKKDDGKGGR